MKDIIKTVNGLEFDMTETNPSVLLDEGLNGASIGVCLYTATEFTSFYGVHEDQEGFYVIEGSGQARLDDEILPVEAGCTFLLAPGVKHSFIRDAGCEGLKVLWFHAAP